MGEVVNYRDGDLWSISRLAEAFGVARRTVSARLIPIKPAGERRGSPVYHIKDASAAILQVGGRGGGIMPDLDQFPEARKAWYQSENERLKFEKEIRQLIPESDVARNMAFLAKTVAAGLDSLPDLLERDAGIEPNAIELVIDVIDGLREVIADVLAKGPSHES